MIKHARLVQIIEKHFSLYPIIVSPDAIEALANSRNLSENDIDFILEQLRSHIQFFEEKEATRYGLFNLVYYAIDALHVPEQKWNKHRVEITREYRDVLEKELQRKLNNNI